MSIDMKPILLLSADAAIPKILEHFKIPSLVGDKACEELIDALLKFIETDKEDACDNCDQRTPDGPTYNEGMN